MHPTLEQRLGKRVQETTHQSAACPSACMMSAKREADVVNNAAVHSAACSTWQELGSASIPIGWFGPITQQRWAPSSAVLDGEAKAESSIPFSAYLAKIKCSICSYQFDR